MSIQEIVVGSGGALVILMTLIQIVPIKVNPWPAIGRALGRVFNGDVIEKLDEIEKVQAKTRQQLGEHIRMDDKRSADLHRAYILRFNTELLRGILYTDEDFNEILCNINCYEILCRVPGVPEQQGGTRNQAYQKRV